MSMCGKQIFLITVVLALLSQTVFAAYAPCDSGSSGSPTDHPAMAVGCHDAGGALPDPIETDHECQLQCACPAGPGAFARFQADDVKLDDMGPIHSLGTPRPSHLTEALFRPPIPG